METESHREGHVTMEAVTGVMYVQPRKDFQEPPEASKTQVLFSKVTKGSTALPTP